MARGGKRDNAGRKSKSDELKVRKLGIDAIESVYGSVEDYYKFIARESKESYPHLKLLQEYVFGKPKETVDTNVSLNNITLSDLVKFGDDK